MTNTPSIIHAKWVITDTTHILKHHALVIQSGLIEAILPSGLAKERYPTVTHTTYASHALLPGFINCHTHLTMNIFRGLADDLELMDWLNNYIWPAENKWLGEELVYDASLLAIAEAIRSGTTCMNDMYFFMNATARAVTETGIRAHIGLHLIDVPTAWAQTMDEAFEKAILFYEEYKNHERITPTMAVHSTYTVSLPQLIKAKKIADDYKLKINIHLQESPQEIAHVQALHQERPLMRLHKIGMVNPDLIAIHMTQINEDDLKILTATKPNIVHCPESNMKLASGIAPISTLMQHGLNVALGTDGAASNNDLDMITEMRSAAFLSKISTQNPQALSAETALNMATINAAKALGVDHKIGSLAIGKAADFIAIDLERIETEPLYHPISQIVYAASRDQVTDVWVAGKQLLKNRQLTTIDEKALLAKVKTWRKRIQNTV
ncbi:MAG: N-ethylammeline chlorohydrolase [Gammaproteobacteria bacterium RIFCSPHIGHO2_12_FULL_42_10]|nr:MAG: N-ethylammeline chlorohydrolase [Gammaproteobacteria bacterium RIFCSPHIGHO2_12_FULL_42_10]